MLPLFSFNPSLEWAKTKSSVGEVDLVFVVDETGSMGSWISTVQKEILAIIKKVTSHPLCKNVQIGVVGYRDHPPQVLLFFSPIIFYCFFFFLLLFSSSSSAPSSSASSYCLLPFSLIILGPNGHRGPSAHSRH